MQPTATRKTKGCGCGVGLVTLAFIGFILWFTMFSNSCAKVMGIETWPLTGDTRHFEPFKEIAQIRAKAGPGAILTDIEATYVRSDGTMDLQADYTPAPGVVYTFQIPTKAPENLPPVGVAGRTAGDAWFQHVTITCQQVGQRRHVTRVSGNSRSSFSYTNEGMLVDRAATQSGKLEKDIGNPKLSCADLWKMALEKDAQKDAVAIIRLDNNGYNFSISGGVHFNLGLDGKPKG
jgi:hypothetical protein